MIFVPLTANGCELRRCSKSSKAGPSAPLKAAPASSVSISLRNSLKRTQLSGVWLLNNSSWACRTCRYLRSSCQGETGMFNRTKERTKWSQSPASFTPLSTSVWQP